MRGELISKLSLAKAGVGEGEREERRISKGVGGLSIILWNNFEVKTGEFLWTGT